MEDFLQIPIDRTEIPQGKLNIDNRTRTNLFAWSGQFSPQFVEAILERYTQKNFLVVDPFLGSGTVLVECARRDLRAHGTVLNVSAYALAMTYELCNVPLNVREEVLTKVWSLIYEAHSSENPVGYIVKSCMNAQDQYIKQVLATLIVISDLHVGETDDITIGEKWALLSEIIRGLPYTKEEIKAQHGDARRINLKDSSSDFLFTSPPYINVFNYHQKYRVSVESLGYDVLKIAKSEFGSNRKNRGNRLLTVTQYCVDIALSLKEASRVCKNGSRMIYVVGRESAVLGYSFCNSELVFNLGRLIFGYGFFLRQERVFKNRFGQMIYEDIIHFENNKRNIGDVEIVERSREIAIEMLKSKLNLENDHKCLLIEAINRADKVFPSEVHNAKGNAWGENCIRH